MCQTCTCYRHSAPEDYHRWSGTPTALRVRFVSECPVSAGNFFLASSSTPRKQGELVLTPTSACTADRQGGTAREPEGRHHRSRTNAGGALCGERLCKRIELTQFGTEDVSERLFTTTFKVTIKVSVNGCSQL